jgi:hypothetical protein
MDLAQALVLVLTFPVLGVLLMVLTTVEKRLPGEPGAGRKAGKH